MLSVVAYIGMTSPSTQVKIVGSSPSAGASRHPYDGIHLHCQAEMMEDITAIVSRTNHDMSGRQRCPAVRKEVETKCAKPWGSRGVSGQSLELKIVGPSPNEVGVAGKR